MELTKNDKKAIEMFTDLIADNIGREELAEGLDRVIWDLTKYKLCDTNFEGHHNAHEDLYYLNLLKQVLLCRYEIPSRQIA